MQVSAITDQTGMQEMGVNPGDFDDDDGGGLVSNCFFVLLNFDKQIFCAISNSYHNNTFIVIIN